MVIVMLETIFGSIAAVLATIRLLPQVYKTIQVKDTSGLSSLYLILLFLQSLFLILYGAAKPDLYIVMMNIIPLLCGALLLTLKYNYSYKKNRSSHQSIIYSSLHKTKKLDTSHLNTPL
jgi:uncharacterized protein with PQ loop repeat